MVQTSIYFISAESSPLQYSSLCQRNTTAVFYGVTVIFYIVCDSIAYAVPVCIVVHGISVGHVYAWFEACSHFNVHALVLEQNCFLWKQFRVSDPECEDENELR